MRREKGEKDRSEVSVRQRDEEGKGASEHQRADEVWICCCDRSRTSWGAGGPPAAHTGPRSVTS